MMIQVGIAGPAEREGVVAEFHVRKGETIEIPAEIFREGKTLMIALFSKTDGVAWEYPLSDFVEAIRVGEQLLSGDTGVS